MISNKQFKRSYILYGIILILIILSSFRVIWMKTFANPSAVHIEEAELDLEGWDKEEGLLFLDGEWEFYPSQLLTGREHDIDELSRQFIQVPGKWNDSIKENDSTSFGYGSYRLRLYMGEADESNYRLHIASVRSASKVFVNGRYLGGMGEVGETKESYKAKNNPYVVTFTPDETGLIDIVIQATNFKDSRNSGIIRSIKFGREDAITRDRALSLFTQGLVSIILLLHAIYALIIYFLGRRERRLLYFAILLFFITLTNGLSNDEKILHLLFNIDYEWGFRLANVAGPICCIALLKSIDARSIAIWRKVSPAFYLVTTTLAIVILFSSPDQIIMMMPLMHVLGGLALIVTMSVLVKKVVSDPAGNILLIFTLVTLVHYLYWEFYWREAGIAIIHYPFDLIIAILLFTSIWFKSYFATHDNTEKLAKRLQLMNEQKDRFLANTAHEFRTPLHAMMNMSQTILQRETSKLESQSTKELHSIVAVGQRMSLLLNDLLDIASLKEGYPRLRKRQISLQPIIASVIDMLQFTIGKKSIEIINQLPSNLPFVYADENRVIQIFYNILHNAVKFTSEGTVIVQAEVREERVFVLVSDTGIGMNSDFLQRLFKPYEQASEEAIMEGGLGLGLNISKQLIELHGGALEVQSTVGEGSEFTFSLELSTDQADSESKHNHSYLIKNMDEVKIAEDLLTDDLVEVTERDMSTVQVSKNRAAILIVDDDPMNLQILQAILSDEGYEIVTAIDGKEALTKLEFRDWALVISDIMMPKMSGYELTKSIRTRYSMTELPVLLLTARSDTKHIQAGFLAGANDYLTKPVEMLELKSRVRALTTLKQAVRDQLQLEGAWLQAQIQPHFLFNVLNSIMALSTIDFDKMIVLLEDLSNYLRSKFHFYQFDELIPLHEELSMVESYVNIEKVRFGEKLEVIWELDKKLKLMIPFLSIQPLVENAITHGIMKKISGGKIVIKISIHDDYAEISVEDNGIGMSENQLAALFKRKEGNRKSIGLINTNERLIRRFGRGIEVKSRLNKGTKVSFRVSL